MGIPDHLTCLLRNLYAGQEATVRTGHGTTDWFQIGKGVRQGCILSPFLFNLYAQYIMRNAGLEEAQAHWTWVWVNFGSWWWTGRPGMLRSTGSQSWTRLSDWADRDAYCRPSVFAAAAASKETEAEVTDGSDCSGCGWTKVNDSLNFSYIETCWWSRNFTPFLS